MANYRWLLCVWFVIIAISTPLSGQKERSEKISPYAFVPNDIGAFFTFDIQRFLKMEHVTQASAVWSELYNELVKDFSYQEFAEESGIDFIQNIHAVTFVFFDTLDSKSDEFAAVFKLSRKRDDLIKSLTSLETIKRVPGFGAYEDVPLLQSDPEIDDPPVYMAFPGNHHLIFGFKHEVKKILAVYRGERPNILVQKEISQRMKQTGKNPIFLSTVFVTDEMITGLKEMELPLDLNGTTAISLTLDRQSLALRLLIPDPAENRRISSYWHGIKAMLSAMQPKNDHERVLVQLSNLLDIQSSPSQLALSLPSSQALPVFEKIIAKELQIRRGTSKAAVTADNIKMVANAVEIYLLKHSLLPHCQSLKELKTVIPAMFANQEYELPEKDGWGNILHFVCNESSYTIASSGSDNRFEGWDQQEGEYSLQSPEDFAKDYIFKNGMFTVGPALR